MKRMPVKLTELERNHCRWVHGNPLKLEEHRYCGREVVPTTSWCMRHLKRVTPAAKTIVGRELMKWRQELEGDVGPVYIASKLTDQDLKEKHVPDILEEMERLK